MVDSKQYLRRIHICGTLWFLLCAAVLLFLSMYQAGLKWWLIFSISGYSAVLLFFLFTIYLFAIFQGVVRNINAIEHPLSTSIYYIALYDLTPFLGSIAGFFAVATDTSWFTMLNTCVQGALGMTFLVWIVIDPLVGLMEASLPSSIAHRKQRLAEMKLLKQKQQEESQKLLESLEQQEDEKKAVWERFFEPYAQEAADLLGQCTDKEHVQKRITELGALAWKAGRLIGMEFFHCQIHKEIERKQLQVPVDYIDYWWDGIGNWRRPSLVEKKQ